MSEFIQEIWLFNKDGNPIAEFCTKDCIEENMVPFFSKEVKSYIQLVSNVIQTFDYEDRQISFIPCIKGLVFLVSISPKDAKKKKILKICEHLVKIFEGLYSADDIIKWDGDIDVFNKFKRKLDLFLKMSSM